MSLYDDKTKIYIGHLPDNISESDIEYYFRPYGYIKTIKLINSFAFINYGNNDSANNAILNMNNKIINGRKIIVQHAINKDSKNKNKLKKPDDEDSNSSNKSDLSENNKINPIIPECKYCGKKGHWVDECTLFFKYLKKKNSKDFFKECFKCGSNEHLEKDCPFLNNKNRSRSRSRSNSKDKSFRKYSDSYSRKDSYNSEKKNNNRQYSSTYYYNNDKYDSYSSYSSDNYSKSQTVSKNT